MVKYRQWWNEVNNSQFLHSCLLQCTPRHWCLPVVVGFCDGKSVVIAFFVMDFLLPTKSRFFKRKPGRISCVPTAQILIGKLRNLVWGRNWLPRSSSSFLICQVRFNNNYSRNLPYPERIRKQIYSIQQTYRSYSVHLRKWLGSGSWTGNSSFKAMNSISQINLLLRYFVGNFCKTNTLANGTIRVVSSS